MTREEAKAWLEHHFDPIPDGTKQSEAVSLAIKALEQEPCEVFDKYGNYKYPNDVELTEPNTATSMPCEDAISRQAAIDAIYKMHMNGKEGVLHDLKTETGSDAFFAETIADAVEALEELPSVNPQPKTGHWILADEQNKEDVENDNYRFICSECQCSDIHAKGVIVPYCWKCGATMIEPQESEEV